MSETKNLVEMTKEELIVLIMSGDLVRGHAGELERQRDAADTRFLAVRQENDDLQQEIAGLTKEMSVVRRVATDLQATADEDKTDLREIFHRGIGVGVLVTSAFFGLLACLWLAFAPILHRLLS